MKPIVVYYWIKILGGQEMMESAEFDSMSDAEQFIEDNKSSWEDYDIFDPRDKESNINWEEFGD